MWVCVCVGVCVCGMCTHVCGVVCMRVCICMCVRCVCMRLYMCDVRREVGKERWVRVRKVIEGRRE